MKTGNAVAITGAVTLGLAAFGWTANQVIRFVYPERLLLLGIIAVLTALFLAWLAWWQRSAEKLGHIRSIRAMTAEVSTRARVARFALAMASAAFMVLAAAGPQWGERTREVKRAGIDVVIAVDVSKSMLAEDAAPNRLGAATREIDRLLRRLEGDRIGLVVFAGIAFIQSPLTSDYGAIRLYMDRLRPDAIPMQGTAIGRAIEEGRRLLVGGDNEEFRRASTQLIIVVTDGEDHESDPIAAARRAREDGIHVFTVGLGTPEGARIPIRARDGTLVSYLQDRAGNVVQSRLVEEQLIQVADAGGGEYRRYTGEGSLASFLESAVDDFDDEALSSMLRSEYTDRPLFFLFPALLLLLLATVLPERRRKTGAAIATMFVLLLASGCDGVRRVDPDIRNAIEASREGDHAAALARADGASAEARAQAEYHYNRGLFLERAGDADGAQSAYLEALAAGDGSFDSSTLTGIGNSLFSREDFEGATERYIRALRADTTHEAARRNLEIAHRRLFPPCRELEDEAEDNDAAENATPLPDSVVSSDIAPPGMQVPPEDAEATEYVACGGDADWFVLPVYGGDTVTVKSTFRRLRDDNGGAPLPDEIPPTDVRIALIAPDGVGPIAVDQGLTGEASDSAQRAATVRRTMEAISIDERFATEGFVYLKVEVDGALEYTYELDVAVIPPCRVVEDEFEENDYPVAGATLSGGETVGRLCAGDPDFYKVYMNTGDDLFVDLSPVVTDDGAPASIGVRLGSVDAVDAMTPQASEPDMITELSVRDMLEPADVALGLTTIADVEGNYQVTTFHYPPCPVGNDEFEPNNEMTQESVAQIPSDRAPLRHMRLCDADNDWYIYQIAPPEEPEEGEEPPETRPFSAMADFEDPARTVIVEIYDPTTLQMVATSQIAPRTPEMPEDRAFAIASTTIRSEVEAMIVRVYGDQGYYHLSFPDTLPQQQQQQQSGDGDSEDESEENSDQQDPSESDDSDQDGESEQPDPSDPDDAESEDSQADQAEELSEDEQARQELMELLNSLEEDDLNLQLTQALENMPPLNTGNEW